MLTLYLDPIFREHDTGRHHPERPERLREVELALRRAGLLDRCAVRAAPRADEAALATNHDPVYVRRVAQVAAQGGGYLDADTPVGPRSYEVACHAAGAALGAAEEAAGGRAAFALLRPPGHHALADQGMGFCLFNNVALAARRALTLPGIQRVAIVDVDVHHGNGTQAAFYEDPRVYFYSTHQFPWYPGAGHERETGRGLGVGTTLNVPLPAGSGDGAFEQARRQLLEPALRRFGPDLLLVSAGYDAHWRDPLAHLAVSTAGFAATVAHLRDLAAELCGGRLMLTLEGGYDLAALAGSVAATCQVLLGEAADDPLGPAPEPERPLGTLIARLAALHDL
ncbi:MAG: histone deacetylase [Chloroflexi bacterium]|nr:histone deacetylase [Chloroflexota bacterium]